MNRYERKFKISFHLIKDITNFLRTLEYTQIYPSRLIRSIYYDSIDFIKFTDSEDGISDRKKLRLRFYDNNVEKIAVENKIKSADEGWKMTKLYKKDLNNAHNLKIESNELVIPKHFESRYFPTLLTNYKRNYFSNQSRKIRITIDSQISFESLRKGSKLKTKLDNFYKLEFGVLEVKYDIVDDANFIINQLSNEFNLNISRCSKYCYGIGLCY